MRDYIHSHDMARFIEAFLGAPLVAEVYNLSDCHSNSCSILEAFQIDEQHSGKTQIYEYVDEKWIDDHISYISQLSKMRAHYPGLEISISLDDIIAQIVESWRKLERQLA